MAREARLLGGLKYRLENACRLEVTGCIVVQFEQALEVDKLA